MLQLFKSRPGDSKGPFTSVCGSGESALAKYQFQTQISAMRALHLRTVRIWENLGINAWISPKRVLPLRPENEQRLQPDSPDLG